MCKKMTELSYRKPHKNIDLGRQSELAKLCLDNFVFIHKTMLAAACGSLMHQDILSIGYGTSFEKTDKNSSKSSR